MKEAELIAKLEVILLGEGAAGALGACAELLRRLRPMDQAGARALVSGDDILSKCFIEFEEGKERENAASLARRLGELARRPACLGCGTCCRKSSPTLYAEDLERMGDNGLNKRWLYTLRPGERVSSIREGKSRLLEREMIKVAERPGAGCVHLRENKCSIYSNRPRQCRRLQCWSGRHAGQDQDQTRLERAAIYAGDQTALALMREYDLKLPAPEITRDLEAAVGGQSAAGERVLAWLELDHRLRLGIGARYGYGPQELPLLLGRPVMEIMGLYGLGVELDGRGRPVLLNRRAGS